MVLAYLGPRIDIVDVVTRDAFTDALEDTNKKLGFSIVNQKMWMRHSRIFEALEDRLDDREKSRKNRFVRTLDSAIRINNIRRQ